MTIQLQSKAMELMTLLLIHSFKFNFLITYKFKFKFLVLELKGLKQLSLYQEADSIVGRIRLNK